MVKRIIKYVGLAVFFYLIYLAVCLLVPPLFHKTTDAAARETFHTVKTDEEGFAKERARSVDTNLDALLWRLRLVEEAQESLVLTTFDFRDESGGQDMMAALWNAANRGVKVQILVDGINAGLFLSGSDNFRQLASHENVEARFYNPINFLTPWKINYRMHDKYLIADNWGYILGGRNTDNRFLGCYEEFYNEDRDILVYETVPGKGESLCQLQNYFERIWNLPDSRLFRKKGKGGNLEAHYQQLKQRYPEAFTPTDWELETTETNRIELCTNSIEPKNKEPWIWDRMIEEMKQASDVQVQTPYIISSKKMYQDLKAVTDSGVSTEILINAVENGTNPFGCTDYLNQKKKIRDTGVHIYEYLGKQAQHTKTVLADDRISIVGSCNFDMRSVYLDTELMLVIDSPEINAQLREQIGQMKESCRHMYPDGTLQDGSQYQIPPQEWQKKLIYSVLRVIIIPIRHLL